MATPKKLILKLLIDKKNKRVVFAESDKDFVDILLSFLAMPIGAIIRILNRQSLLGCMDTLYESIENLHDKYFNTEACKTMLLNPLNAYRTHCEDLFLRIDDSNPRRFYKCKKPECGLKSFPFFSSVSKARCGCGEIMDMERTFEKKEWKGPNGDGVFVKGIETFLVTDDLHIMPASTKVIQSLFEKLGIEDWGSIEESAIDVDTNMLRNMLKGSLLSKSLLSVTYFKDPNMADNVELKFRPIPKFEEDLTKESKKFKVKFIVCKSTNKVVYVEAGEGFVDLLLSFLTFPLGSIVKLLDKFSSIGCYDNLYKSMENLSIKSDECKSLLLDPKLATYFGCSDSLLPGIEILSLGGELFGCHTCYIDSKVGTLGTDRCKHGVKHVSIDEMNPKLHAMKEAGGGYVKKEVKYMITDELQVTPFSLLGSVQTVKKQNVTFSSLEEKEIEIREYEALNLLKSCLTSLTPLSAVFTAIKQQKSVH